MGIGTELFEPLPDPVLALGIDRKSAAALWAKLFRTSITMIIRLVRSNLGYAYCAELLARLTPEQAKLLLPIPQRRPGDTKSKHAVAANWPLATSRSMRFDRT
jgi:DNA-binding transcriptional LysR family regulator